MPYPTDFQHACVSCSRIIRVPIEQVRNDRDFYCPECDELNDASDLMIGAIQEATQSLLLTGWPDSHVVLDQAWGAQEKTLLISSHGRRYSLVVEPEVIRSARVIGAVEAVKRLDLLDELKKRGCVRLTMDGGAFALRPCAGALRQAHPGHAGLDAWK